MNISSEIASIHESNSSHYFFSNDTKVQTEFSMSTVVYIGSIMLGFPINSYVIWLIVRETGNGLAVDFFILSISVCEILLCVKAVLVFILLRWFSINYDGNIPWMLVTFLDGIVMTGRPLFQSLICVERYLAVVHPVTFLNYKPLRYRLMCFAVAWVATFFFGAMSMLTSLFYWFDINFIFLIQFLILLSIQLFCCVAVLRALKQSGPGERGREREEENHMKRRAFHLILITTFSMIITYLPLIILMLFLFSQDVDMETVMYIAYAYFALGGLVQPFMFLYRMGKLNFIKCQ